MFQPVNLTKRFASTPYGFVKLRCLKNIIKDLKYYIHMIFLQF